MAVPMYVRLESCSPMGARINIYAAAAGVTGGDNLDFNLGDTQTLLMPEALFGDAFGASVIESDTEGEQYLNDMAQMRDRIKELEEELSSRENEPVFDQAGTLSEQSESETDGLLKEEIKKDLSNLKVAQLEDIQKNYDIQAEGSKSDRVDAISEALDNLKGGELVSLSADVHRKVGGNKK